MDRKAIDRAAFPDEFNKRVGSKRPVIANAVDNGHEFLRSILISVEPQREELPTDQTYEVLLLGVMAQEISLADLEYLVERDFDYITIADETKTDSPL